MTSETGELKENINKDGTVQIKRILVPLDGSNCSFRAAKYAIEAARLQKAQIFCIHVITKIPYGYSLPGSSIDEYFENAKNQAQGWFNKVTFIATKGWTEKSDNVADIKAEVFRNFDSATNAIIDYTTKNKIDLIIIGTKGRTGLKRFLMGSVAQGVVHHAHCPVLFVR